MDFTLPRDPRSSLLTASMNSQAETLVNNQEPTWLTTVNKKRHLRSQLIEPFLQAGRPDESIIAIEDVSELARKISDGELKAYDVSVAYIHQ